MKKYLAFFLFAVLIFFHGCKPSRSDESEVEAKLTDGTWHQTEYWIDNNMDGIFDHITEPCITDNTWRFESDGDFIWDEGDESCDGGIPFVSTAHWELLNNDSQIKVTFDFDPEDPIGLAIDEISNNLLLAHTIYFDDPTAPVFEKFEFHR